jgi:hypothetical protein
MQILHESRVVAWMVRDLGDSCIRMVFLGGYEEMIPKQSLVLMRATKGCVR